MTSITCLFDVTQADLNWENENVRRGFEYCKILDGKGCKGSLRCNQPVSKAGLRTIRMETENSIRTARRFTSILKNSTPTQLRTGSADRRRCRMSSTTMENCFQYAGADTGELTMVFSFHHLKVDFMGNENGFSYPLISQKLKDIMFDWQVNMEEHNT